MTTETDIREPETANTGRATNGRFQLGNPGGPGNPLAGRVTAARRVLMDRITDEELTAILDRVIAMAKDGHWQAIKLVLGYVFGKPGKLPDPDALDEACETPSPNGVFSAPPADVLEAAPSPNGVFSAPQADVPAAAPSPNGVFSAPPADAPLPNGVFCENPVSANGSPEVATPSPAPTTPLANGVFSPPPRNRKERRAQRKAERIAQRQAARTAKASN